MISKRLAGLLGALALAVLVFVWRIATRPVVGPGDAAYRQALDARDRGESETAVARLQQAIMSEPGNGEYHSDLGHLYVEIRRFDLAAAEFEAAAFLLPPAAAPTANAWLARCLVELRRREESLAVVELALKQDPRLAVAYAVRGEQRLRDDNLNEALSDFRKTLELSPDFGLAYQKAGYILYQSQQYEEAKQMLERGLQRNPGDVGAHLLLAQTLLQLGGDPPTQALAEQHLRAALVNNPEAHRVHAALGQLALRRNQLAEARAAFEASLSTHPRFQEARFGL
ncbi:MAG: tetratricopeptide repeat protein, partial [Armatimonadetes bacterium]|nr:tetratricopeptide repeat protein [Armatimonadota bacterium]